MLQRLSEQVQACYQRADDARLRAERTDDPARKADFLEMEKHWLTLARSHEFSERLSNFIASNLDWQHKMDERLRSARRLGAAGLQKIIQEDDFDVLFESMWLASIVESSDDAIISKNLDGVIMSWNSGAQRLFGYLPEEAVGKPITIIIPPDRHHEEDMILGHIRRGERVEHYETVRRRKDGSLVDISLTVSPIMGAEGRVLGASKIARDITERKQKEAQIAALAREAEQQADLLNQSHDAIFAWKIGGAITYWSRGAEQLYGYTSKEAIGRISHELLRTRSNVSDHERETQTAETGSWYGELTHTTRDGHEIIVESRHVRVSYDGELYALETNRDVTERKCAEEQIRLLMHEAAHRAKNMLSLVAVVARQIAAADPQDFIERFSERVQALAASQDLLVRNQWQGSDIEDLVHAQLAHFGGLVGTRIVLHGPKLSLTPNAAQTIGLAFHELATNAGKYGALSTDAGEVEVAWRVDGTLFTLTWTERNGPPVQRPERRGFGSIVVGSMAKWNVGGEVQLDYPPSGLEWRLTCSVANALSC